MTIKSLCRYVEEYLAIGEAPEQVRNCFQQRSRWCKVRSSRSTGTQAPHSTCAGACRACMHAVLTGWQSAVWQWMQQSGSLPACARSPSTVTEGLLWQHKATPPKGCFNLAAWLSSRGACLPQRSHLQ